MAADRLNAVIARAGLASRRAADALIAAGRVTVNGSMAITGQRVDPTRDRIVVDGRPLPEAATSVHLMVNKPRGVLSSARSERGRQSVVELVEMPAGMRLYPVGRLDVDSEGLILLTNDGDWAEKVAHPRYGLEREYAALVDPPPDAAAIHRLLTGVELDDGPARLLAVHLSRRPRGIDLDAGDHGEWLRVTLAEGRKREVRRLFAAVGSQVRRLVRVGFGPVSLGSLPSGEWRHLTNAEVAALAGRGTARRSSAGELTVAIDGTSGSGKTTIGREVAARLGARLVDTGLLYRALTDRAIAFRTDLDDGPALAQLAGSLRITITAGEKVIVDGRPITARLRRPEVDRAVSAVSRHPEVRSAMLAVQRQAARGGPTVMVGRDIGTVVLPDADLKVFLTASEAVRARRRAAQMEQPDRVDEYRRELAARDAVDTGRAVAPLRQAQGSLVLDTGRLDVDSCVAAIIAALDAA
jgi:23S rRNA pseudouridine2605 synthase